MSNLKITESTGNIFIELGFDAQVAEELLLKTHLFHSLQDAIRTSKMTHKEMVALLGTDQSKLTKVMRGKMSEFSVEQITRFLRQLRVPGLQDVQPQQ